MTRETKFNNITFNTPKVQTRVICGIEVTIERIDATQSPEVISYLLADIGEIAGRLLSEDHQSARDSLEEEAGILAQAATVMTDLRSLIGSAGMVGLCSQIRNKKCVDIRWYMEKFLVGNMSVSGIVIDSLDDLKTLKADIPTIWKLIQYAAEVNFAPFFADPSTEDGSTASEEADPVPDPPKDPILMSSNLNGGTPTAGH